MRVSKNYYDKCGIYAICVNDCIVYCGQSKKVFERFQQHVIGIKHYKKDLSPNKYQLLGSARKHGLPIYFLLLEECEAVALDVRERAWINCLKPCLNSSLNNGRGKRIDSNEFFNEIYSTSFWIDNELVGWSFEDIEGLLKVS